jgi:hypothetical protein
MMLDQQVYKKLPEKFDGLLQELQKKFQKFKVKFNFITSSNTILKRLIFF